MPLNTTKLKLTDWKRRYMYALRCSFFESICTQQLIFLKVYCNRPFSRGSHTLIGLKLHIIISNLNFVLSWILAREAVDESKGATVIPGTNMWTKNYLDLCPLDAWKSIALWSKCSVRIRTTQKWLRCLLQIKVERKKILSDEKYVMRAGFVSFNSRWGAAVCAQTQQSKDHTKWLTEWAPEPRDVYWNNLALPYMMLNFRRLVISLVVFALVFFHLFRWHFSNRWQTWIPWTDCFAFLKPVTTLWVSALHTQSWCFIYFYVSLGCLGGQKN